MIEVSTFGPASERTPLLRLVDALTQGESAPALLVQLEANWAAGTPKMIYTVNLKTDKFSTKFEDWIEKNLLKIAAFNVRGVELNDYSLSENVTRDGVVLRMKKNSLVKLGYDDAKRTTLKKAGAFSLPPKQAKQ